MSYDNPRNRNRLLNIAVASNLFAEISTKKNRNAINEPLLGSDQHFYLTPEIGNDKDVYNMPFLLDSGGSPWSEANSYLCYLVENKHSMQRPTDSVHRTAARLLDYKLFTEDEDIDWLNFGGKRISSRPSYRYFYYLTEVRGLSAEVVNQYTGDVYDFYKFVSDAWHPHISMKRVDSTKTARVYYSTHTGSGSREYLKRSQTKPTPPKKPTPLGYVYDDGEKLRPLSVEQIVELKQIINGVAWSPFERLLILIPLLTGARKQSVLTLRMRHIKQLVEAVPEVDGTRKLHIGPSTLVNTKHSKKQVLYFPPQLAVELEVYANCKQAKDRRDKFKKKYALSNPDLPTMNAGDIYLFLSEQGNCYYMGKDDPRYPRLRRAPSGQVADQLKRKIFRAASDCFPRDFYYHWLRATYAYLLWLSLQKYIDEGVISVTVAISFIQTRLYHKSRETTENYLKLFQNIDIQMRAQEAFEDILLPDALIEEQLSELLEKDENE